MWPSSATIYIAAIGEDQEWDEVLGDYNDTINSWDRFVHRLQFAYGIDMTSLKADYEGETEQYYYNTARWQIIEPAVLVGEAQPVYSIDLKQASFKDAEGISDSEFSLMHSLLKKNSDGTISRVKDFLSIKGFALWFTIDFHGGSQHSTMSTGPENGYTHWGQYACYLHEPLKVAATQEFSGSFGMTRKKHNPRMYNLNIKVFSMSATDESKKTVLVDRTYDLP